MVKREGGETLSVSDHAGILGRKLADRRPIELVAALGHKEGRLVDMKL
jgi:hypothetical protein